MTHRIAYSISRGVYAAGELAYLWEPLDGARAGRRVVLYHHGTGGETVIIEPVYAVRDNLRVLLRDLIGRGFAVLSCDFGGPETFGNATNQARIDDAVTWLGTLGFRTDKLAMVGESMGHQCVYKWAHSNPAKVAAVVGWIPGCDLDQTYANQAGFATIMDAAHGGSWAAASATHNPVEMSAPSWADVWRCYAASDDPIQGARLVDAQALGAHIGNPTGVIDTGPGGHTDVGMAGVAVSDFVDFIDRGRW